MLEIRRHLDACAACRAECESLRDVKRLLSSLALRTPRADLESLLRADALRASHPVARWLPAAWSSAWREGAVPLPRPRPRPRPLAAAAVLSLATLFLATATLDSPGGSSSARIPAPDVYRSYVEQSAAAYPASLPVADPTPPIWSADGGNYRLLSIFNDRPAVDYRADVKAYRTFKGDNPPSE
jgi:hypothetical protein